MPAPRSTPRAPRPLPLALDKAGFSPEGIDAAKGLFILLIVLGHNSLLNEAFPSVNRFVYYFHVHVFFLISALMPTKAWSPGWCRDRLVRYGVPYLIFVLISWCAYQIVFTGGGFSGLTGSLGDLGGALLTGTGDALKDATGFKFFWFIPAFIVFVNLRALMQHSRLLAIGIGLFALVPLCYGWQLPGWIRQGNPWGLYIALWILPFTWIVGACLPVLPKVNFKLRLQCFGIAFFGLQGLVILLDLHRLGLSGFALPPLWNLPWFITTLLLVPCAFFFFLHASESLRRSRLLRFAGAQSLVIYLVHGFFQIPAVLVAEKLLAKLPANEALTFGFILASCLVAISGSLCCAWAITKIPRLQKIIFPGNWQSWKQSLYKVESGK